MKKLKLQAVQFGAIEVLTRTQLKNILGGDGSGDAKECTKDADCGTKTITNACGDQVTVSGVCSSVTHKCSWGTAC